MLRLQWPRAGTGCQASEPQGWSVDRPGSASRVRSTPPPVAPSAALPERRSGVQSPRAGADRSLQGRTSHYRAAHGSQMRAPPRSPARTVKEEVKSRQRALVVCDHAGEGSAVRGLHGPDPRQVPFGPRDLSEVGQVLSSELRDTREEAMEGAGSSQVQVRLSFQPPHPQPTSPSPQSLLANLHF